MKRKLDDLQPDQKSVADNLALKKHVARPLAQRKTELYEVRKKLPIWTHASEIKHGLRGKKHVLVLTGETGSGKSTQVPQFLVDEPWCKKCIAITQPRRVAAISLAKRVAEEMGSPLGSSSPASKVGYSVRFDTSISPSTRIKFLTEGMLLQELLRDPSLRQYSAVIVDEVHERGVNVDLILGFLKKIITDHSTKRKGFPLKAVIMSATADTEHLYNFFRDNFNEATEQNGSVLVAAREQESEDQPKGSSTYGIKAPETNISTCYIKGRQFPVETIYTQSPVNDFAEAALKTIFQIHYKEPLPGDILVFLTGQDVVESVEALVNELAAGMGTEIPKLLALPLFAALPSAAQQAVFAPTPSRTRKVILATNIAETSVTIPGVKYVVDSGLAKTKEYRTQLGLDSLLVKPVSKSSANQRKGRAGREAPGMCYRLYTEKDYLQLQPSNVPEILRCNLAQSILIMKARGINDVLNFPFMDKPSPEAMRRALMHLYRLGALEDTGMISALGKSMARFPLSPAQSRVLLAAAEPKMDCLLEIIDIIASLTVENVFLNLSTEDEKEEASAARSELEKREGDHMTLMSTVQAFANEQSDRKAWAARYRVSHRAMRNILDVRKQLRSQCRLQSLLPPLATNDSASTDLPTPAYSPEKAIVISKCLLQGFATNVARLMPDGSYKTVEGNQLVTIHPSSVIFGRKLEAILYNELVFTSKCYARGVTAIQLDWYSETISSLGQANG